MSDLRTKFLPLFRRSSTSSATSSIASTDAAASLSPNIRETRSRGKLSIRTKNKPAKVSDIQEEDTKHGSAQWSEPPATASTIGSPSIEDLPSPEPARVTTTAGEANTPVLIFEEATPDSQIGVLVPLLESTIAKATDGVAENEGAAEQLLRKQSLTLHADHRLIRSLLHAHVAGGGEDGSTASSSGMAAVAALDRSMVHRKIWVKRAGASATLVQIKEDDLVDDVRDMILKKYANSLGRSFDSPDVTLRIVARDHSHRHGHAERTLGPEEHMARTLDTYYPGGQTVEEALVIDVPIRRTPRHSPRVGMPYYQVSEDMRPAETDQGYFPAMPPGVMPSPHLNTSISAAGSTGSDRHHHSISVLNTGVLPPLPSPGSRSARPGHRPRAGRNNTSSPTANINPSSHNVPSSAVAQSNPYLSSADIRLHTNVPSAPPLPTPPVPASVPVRAATPPPRPASPRPKQRRSSKRNSSTAPTSLPAPLLDGTVPPINVLIVEDNVINLKLLEAFMKRLKVRYHSAMNGRDAVSKWREGGFHLVLMDIQLPLMNGLDATKEIRRLESSNGVGVLAADGAGNGMNGRQNEGGPVADKDKLNKLEMFKSSVIIVALTASSLQSDRHEALAAGCNDFLTKPVNFVWLERKVTEWGCMQALIDFDGWRRWKQLPTVKPAIADPKAARAIPAAAATAINRQDILETHSSEGTTGSSSDVPAAGLNIGTAGAVRARSHSEVSKPDVKVQAPTPPPAAPAKLATVGGSDGAAAKLAPGAKDVRRAKRGSLGPASGLTGVVEERDREEGREVGVGA